MGALLLSSPFINFYHYLQFQWASVILPRAGAEGWRVAVKNFPLNAS